MRSDMFKLLSSVFSGKKRVRDEMEGDMDAFEDIDASEVASDGRIRWSSAQDQELLAAVKKYGENKWILIAAEVSGGVNNNSCRKRFNRLQTPSLELPVITRIRALGIFTLEQYLKESCKDQNQLLVLQLISPQQLSDL
jgi:hypothetical protein